ncbi:MAG: beta-galactosidase, partial [Duncaniella sp.]|nr:beta-galactosidase [Duncaniella sp.]
LSGSGWRLVQDREAQWQNDPLFLPGDFASVSELPYNPPTMGWQGLAAADGVAVSVPGTLEEYLTVNANPQPTDQSGVSWWVRTLDAPKLKKGERAVLRFGSVRHRAEVFIDSTLVGYDMVAETPFDVDITDALREGKGPRQLAVRITHPGGNYHWQDFTPMTWGEYQMLPSRGFGGILAPVRLDIVPEVNIADIYVQNQPRPDNVKVYVTVDNRSGKARGENLIVRLTPKGDPLRIVAEKRVPLGKLAEGETVVEVPFECPGVELWSPETPALYTCEASLSGSRDAERKNFGFRWFAPKGIGEDAMLTLNGRRVMLRSGISWGFWPVTGLYPAPEMAVRQVEAAKSMGLNMVNFHRNIGSTAGLEAADSLGMFYFEEPGGFHSATHDPFMRRMAAEKLNRMVRRDRSHPSLIIYNLINEWGGPNAADTALTLKRHADMRAAHAIDPSRVMTFTSGWAGREDRDEFAKANMQPFDTTLYLRGWFDNHRAGGPATWEQKYYRSPSDNFMHTTNRTEVYMRGEEGAISTPPRIAKIHEEIARTGLTGWDGLFWENQYEAFDRYFRSKNLAPYFGDIDSLTRLMGDIQLDHQGRRIQGMRMQDIGDVYVINGWESMPYDNHSGVVDDYRNVKGNLPTIARYNRPAYVAVCPRSQFGCPGDTLAVDLWSVNEADIRGPHTLSVTAVSPSGRRSEPVVLNVMIEGGDRFGQLLGEATRIPLGDEEGMYAIEAVMLDTAGNTVMDGRDGVLVLDDRATQADLGNGAFYGSADSPVREYYAQVTGRELPLYEPGMRGLDWILVGRSMLDEPEPIPAEAIGADGFETTYYAYHDLAQPRETVTERVINHTFVEGEQPHSSLPANQGFSAIWRGELTAPADGIYMLGVKSNRGVRLRINDVHLIDEWHNLRDITEATPMHLSAGQKVKVEVQYRQTPHSGYVQLVWTLPGRTAVSADSLLTRVREDGTRLVLLTNADTWIETLCGAIGADYKGTYTVGSNWVGGVHFVKESPLFDPMPVNTSMGWPYQAVVRDGNHRTGFEIDGEDMEDMIVGSYRSWPFHLGGALGSLPYGKGEVVYNTLDIESNLLNPDNSASVARRLFKNLLTKPVK